MSDEPEDAEAAGRKRALRRAQTRLALAGNADLLIWLGKQELGQREPAPTPAVELPMAPPTPGRPPHSRRPLGCFLRALLPVEPCHRREARPAAGRGREAGTVRIASQPSNVVPSRSWPVTHASVSPMAMPVPSLL